MDAKSKAKLQSCHYSLQRVIGAVDKWWPGGVVVIEGQRSRERQDELFADGKSKLRGDDIKAMHCHEPSDAVDVAPREPDGSIDWNNVKKFYYFAGFVMGIAAAMGESLRCGADWDGDGEVTDQTFNDLVHFERL